MLYDNKYIIINCCKGFAIIYIKTKELVQYIEDFLGLKYGEKEFILNSKNSSIYIIYKNDEEDDSSESDCVRIKKQYEIKIFVLKYIDGSFQIVEEYEKFENRENLHLFYIDDDRLLLFDKNIYMLK